MTDSEQGENSVRNEDSAENTIVEPANIDESARETTDTSNGSVEEQHELAESLSGTMQAHQANHRYSRDVLLTFGKHNDLKNPPEDLEASGIYRELLGTLFCARSAPEVSAPDNVKLRPGGSFPVRDQEAPRPIPNGPPGVPRDGTPSSWKEQDNSWRTPFKGSPSGSQPIRSRLVDDSPAVISPPGGPPGLTMRRGPIEGPPGAGEWHPGSEGWRRAGGPPQEWRGPPGPMGEEDEALSPRRHGSARVSQDMERWGSSKVPGRNNVNAWRPNAQPGRGAVGRGNERGNEWDARRGRAAPPPGLAGRGTPPPGFDGPPGFPTKPVAKDSRAAGAQGQEQPRNGKAVGDGKPRGLEGDWRAAKEKSAADSDLPEGETPGERMRREFEEERQRLQDQRKKGGHTAQQTANETMGDILGDDELEEMRLRDNGEVAQTGDDTQAAPTKSSAAPEGEQEQQQKPMQPPPGFSANHLFGDVDDDDPLDLVTNLSFLNDTEEEEKPPLTKEKSSRFANFFQSETSTPGAAMGPAAAAGMTASQTSGGGPATLQGPFHTQLGGQALLQQLQAAQHQQQQQQAGHGQGGQQDLLAKLAQAAAAHPHLQRAVPNANARTLDDIEAAVRGSAPPNSLMGAFQQGPQGAKPGNALLSLLQGSSQNAFGQEGGMPNRGEMAPQAQGRSDGLPQPTLDPLLAHFSAMGMAQNARQNPPLPQQQQNPLGQGLGQFGAAGANANQQNTLASLLAGAYSQTPGQSAGMGNQGLPLNLMQQQEQLLRARASLPGQASVQLPGAMPMAQNLHQNFAGLQQQLQQQPQQPNLGHLNQFMPQQQQARPQALNEHQQNILRLLQQQQQRQQQALQLQQQLQQQQRLAQLQAQAQQQRMTPLQALQMQLQLQQQLGRQQQQMAGQQNFGSNAGNAGNIGGLERFFQNAAQRPTMPAQGGARPMHEDLERRFNAPR